MTGELKFMPKDMKKIIAETMIKMIKKKGSEKITVTALIEECHISRQTFYYHFKDLMDVLEWSVCKGTEHIVAESLKADDMKSALEIFISFSSDRFIELSKLMDSGKRAELEELITDAVEGYLLEVLKKNMPEISVNYSDMKTLLRFNAFGLAGTLLDFCKNPQTDREKLAEQLEKMISLQFLNFVSTYSGK
jgi:AcrR family transcriptional regulator